MAKYKINESDYIVEYFGSKEVHGKGYGGIVKLVARGLGFIWNKSKKDWIYTPGLLGVLTDPINYAPLKKEEADKLIEQFNKGKKIAVL